MRELLGCDTADGRSWIISRNELVIKFEADQFARDREGEAASVALVLAIRIAVENARDPYGV